MLKYEYSNAFDKDSNYRVLDMVKSSKSLNLELCFLVSLESSKCPQLQCKFVQILTILTSRFEQDKWKKNEE